MRRSGTTSIGTVRIGGDGPAEDGPSVDTAIAGSGSANDAPIRRSGPERLRTAADPGEGSLALLARFCDRRAGLGPWLKFSRRFRVAFGSVGRGTRRLGGHFAISCWVFLGYRRNQWLSSATDLTFERSAVLDAQRFFEKDFALNTGGLLELHAIGPDHAAFDFATDHHFSCKNVAVDGGIPADDELRATNVALHLAINLDVAFALEVAFHGQPSVDHRARRCPGALPQRLSTHVQRLSAVIERHKTVCGSSRAVAHVVRRVFYLLGEYHRELQGVANQSPSPQ